VAVPPELRGTWVLVEWADTATLPRDAITLSIADGRIVGNSACNAYFGTISADDQHRMRVSLPGTTFVLCAESAATAERTYRGQLLRVDSWARDGDSLALAADGVDTLRFSPAP